MDKIIKNIVFLFLLILSIRCKYKINLNAEAGVFDYVKVYPDKYI